MKKWCSGLTSIKMCVYVYIYLDKAFIFAFNNGKCIAT